MSYEPLELRTHTTLWQVEKRLYKIYDFTLPMPVSVKQLGIFFSVGVPWVLLMKLVHLPFHTPWHLLWIAPPAIGTWYANKPVAEGKRLIEFLSSQIRYFFQAEMFARLRPFKPDRAYAVRAEVWRPDEQPDITGPAPELQTFTALLAETDSPRSVRQAA